MRLQKVKKKAVVQILERCGSGAAGLSAAFRAELGIRCNNSLKDIGDLHTGVVEKSSEITRPASIGSIGDDPQKQYRHSVHVSGKCKRDAFHIGDVSFNEIILRT